MRHRGLKDLFSGDNLALCSDIVMCYNKHIIYLESTEKV